MHIARELPKPHDEIGHGIRTACRRQRRRHSAAEKIVAAPEQIVANSASNARARP